MHESTKTSSPGRAERVPPHSNEAEQAVLGAMLVDSEAVGMALEVLRESRRFYSPAHRRIFAVIAELFEKSKPADITTVADELERQGHLENTGGRGYLADLAAGIASAANVEHWATIVLEKGTMRDMISASTEIIAGCYRQDETVEEMLDGAEQKIFSISEGRLRTDFTSVKELVPSTFEKIEEYKESKGGLVGEPTGFTDLDEVTAGFHSGDLIIIAGRPSMGKSALTLNIAENFCLQTGKAAAFFSLEMSKEQLALRLLCGKAKVSSHRLRTGKMSDSDWSKLSSAAGPLTAIDFYIDDTASMSVLQMRAKSRRLAARTDLGMIIVDYMQLMTGSRHAENRQQEISMISRGLKGLARELGVPVVACSQLSRGVEMRPNKRPMLADLRESGAIEQDADLVMFVYREEYYLSKELKPDDHKLLEAEGKAEIIVAKQRNGPTGIVYLSFLKDFARFENQAAGFRAAPGPSGPSGPPPDSMEPPPF